MKRLSLLILIIGLIFICSQNTNAQESKDKKKKETKVKVLIKKDGKTIEFDTIIHEFKDHKALIEIMKSKNLPDSLLEVFEGEDFMWISDDKDSHGKHKVIIKEFLDSDGHKKMKHRISKNIQIISSDDDHENIIITECDGKNKTIKIEIIDEDGDIHLKHKDGKKIYIINEDINMSISSDSKVKIIKINCQSDYDEDIDIEVEVTDDGKVIKKIKKKKLEKAKKEKK
jgi:hypothetical protein